MRGGQAIRSIIVPVSAIPGLLCVLRTVLGSHPQRTAAPSATSSRGGEEYSISVLHVLKYVHTYVGVPTLVNGRDDVTRLARQRGKTRVAATAGGALYLGYPLTREFTNGGSLCLLLHQTTSSPERATKETTLTLLGVRGPVLSTRDCRHGSLVAFIMCLPFSVPFLFFFFYPLYQGACWPVRTI